LLSDILPVLAGLACVAVGLTLLLRRSGSVNPTVLRRQQIFTAAALLILAVLGAVSAVMDPGTRLLAAVVALVLGVAGGGLLWRALRRD
jgi:hypothetical protein